MANVKAGVITTYDEFRRLIGKFVDGASIFCW